RGKTSTRSEVRWAANQKGLKKRPRFVGPWCPSAEMTAGDRIPPAPHFPLRPPYHADLSLSKHSSPREQDAPPFFGSALGQSSLAPRFCLEARDPVFPFRRSPSWPSPSGCRY